MYIAYEIKFWPYSWANGLEIGNGLFGTVQLTKSPDPDKTFSSGYGMRYDVRLTFSLSNGSGFGKNITVVGVENSSSAPSNNEKRYLNSW